MKHETLASRLIILALIVSPFLTESLYAQWVNVGAGTVSAGSALYSSIALDSHGNPIIVYEGSTSEFQKAIVQQFTGTTWSEVGPEISNGTAIYTTISVDTANDPWVAYQLTASNQVTVEKLDSGVWDIYGSPGLTAYQSYPYVLSDRFGKTYVALEDDTNLIVRTYTPGSGWSNAGSQAFFGDGGPSILAEDLIGNLYIAYLDFNGGNGITVKELSGGNWNSVGSRGFTGNVNGSSSKFSFAIDRNDSLYVAFADSAMSYRLSVMKYNGTSWVYLGSRGFASNGDCVSLTFDMNNIPYVAYDDASNCHEAWIMQYTGGSWVAFGSAISSDQGADIQLIADSTALFIVYEAYNWCNSNSLGQATVKMHYMQGVVWPGDANRDGIANQYDVLALGLAYGDFGSPRSGANNSWTAQFCPAWIDSFSTGINVNNADCNGDGIVNAGDTLPILLNYGQTHAKTGSHQRTPGAPPLYLQITNAPVAAGDTAKFNIVLGDSAIAATNIYGLAFSVSYDGTLLDANSIQTQFSNSWLGSVDTNLLPFSYNSSGSDQLDIAVTRTDHTTRSGSGAIGQVSVITLNNIIAKDTVWNTLVLDVTGVIAIDSAGNAIPIDGQSDTLTVYSTTSGISNINTEQPELMLYPNPASGSINLTSSQMISSYAIYTPQGEKINAGESLNTKQVTIDLGGLANGIYFVQATIGQQRITKRFVIAD